MAISIRRRWEPERELAFGGISAAFAKVGTALAHPARQIIYQNLTDVPLAFSWNGVDNHLTVPAYTSIFDDVTTNRTVSNDVFQAAGDFVWVRSKGVDPSVGSVCVSIIYTAEH